MILRRLLPARESARAPVFQGVPWITRTVVVSLVLFLLAAWTIWRRTRYFTATAHCALSVTGHDHRPACGEYGVQGPLGARASVAGRAFGGTNNSRARPPPTSAKRTAHSSWPRLGGFFFLAFASSGRAAGCSGLLRAPVSAWHRPGAHHAGGHFFSDVNFLRHRGVSHYARVARRVVPPAPNPAFEIGLPFSRTTVASWSVYSVCQLLLIVRTMNTSSTHSNALIRETSPYLLQHAHNPVNWQPWNTEALEQARREDKPILLSSATPPATGATLWQTSRSKTKPRAGNERTVRDIKGIARNAPTSTHLPERHQMPGAACGRLAASHVLSPDDHSLSSGHLFSEGTALRHAGIHPSVPAGGAIHEHREEVTQQNATCVKVSRRLSPWDRSRVNTDHGIAFWHGTRRDRGQLTQTCGSDRRPSFRTRPPSNACCVTGRQQHSAATGRRSLTWRFSLHAHGIRRRVRPAGGGFAATRWTTSG